MRNVAKVPDWDTIEFNFDISTTSGRVRPQLKFNLLLPLGNTRPTKTMESLSWSFLYHLTLSTSPELKSIQSFLPENWHFSSTESAGKG